MSVPLSTTVLVRLYGVDGHYRSEPFMHRDAVYRADDHRVVTAVRVFERGSEPLRHSDLAWLEREEVRLVAAISLSLDPGHGAFRFAPTREPRRIAIDLDAPLNGDAGLALVSQAAKSLDRIPPDAEYSTMSRPSDDTAALFDGIGMEDDLLLRGLYTFLKAGHLMACRSGDFMEEAAMNLHISLEAALEIVREHLHGTGSADPTMEDAKGFLQEQFEEMPALRDFLDELYELWIIAKHPVSRHAAHWAPPYIADDVFEPFDLLVSIYRRILGQE